MRHCHILILLCCFTFAAFSQDTVNRVNSEGFKEGYWKKTDSAGNKAYEGKFRNGLPSGTFKYYYPDGKLKAVSVFSADGKQSKTTTFFVSGKKMAEGIYRDEKRDSIWQFYSDYDGAVLSEESYKNGRKDGPAKTFYAGKGVAEVISWKDGIREGPWIQYYLDGKVKMKTANHNDLKSGLMEAYSEKGILLFTGKYLNGNPEGTWLSFDEKGTPVKKEIYEKGLLIKSEEIPVKH